MKFNWITILSIIANIGLLLYLIIQLNSGRRGNFSFDDVMDINAKYDYEAIEIIRSLDDDANCIDIGAHKGFFTDIFLDECPDGSHYAVEPLPHLYNELKNKYGDNVIVFSQALSNERGTTKFNYIVSNPGYSGLKQRNTDRAKEEIKEIEVELELLDSLIDQTVEIDFIKIDVEGAEFWVLQGARRILEQHKPLIIFEYGYDSRDLFGATPELMYDFFDGLGYKLTLMEYHLRNAPPFNRDSFINHFNQGYNWYFLALPA